MKAAIFSTLCLLAICSPARAQGDPQIYKPGNGVTAPKLLKEVKAEYPPEAMKAGVAGIVKMECVVQTDGTPSDIRVVAPLDPTVDAAAIQALKGWKFSPGQKDGQAVPVLVQVEMSFTTVRGPRLGSTDVFRSGPGVTLPEAGARNEAVVHGDGAQCRRPGKRRPRLRDSDRRHRRGCTGEQTSRLRPRRRGDPNGPTVEVHAR